MTFSVVIPLYNKERYIERAIESVLAQNLPDFELIVVNDGSTDGSERKLRRYIDPRVRVVNQDNAGEAAARNKGISLARANYIAFLDADDTWKDCFLSEIAAISEASPNVFVYGTAFEVKEEVGEPVRYWESDIENIIGGRGTINYLECLARSIYPVNSSCVCVRRQAFAAVGHFDPELRIGADIDMWIRLASLGPFGYSAKVAATYYRDAENRSDERIDFHERRVQFLEKLAGLREKWSGSAVERANFARYMSKQVYSEAYWLYSSAYDHGEI